MLHFPKWKVAVVLIVLLVGTVLAIPSMMPRNLSNAMPGWFPKQTVTLGLDLQGGAHLLLRSRDGQAGPGASRCSAG